MTEAMQGPEVAVVDGRATDDGEEEGVETRAEGYVRRSPVEGPDTRVACETINQLRVTTTVTVTHGQDAPTEAALGFLALARLALAARHVMDDDQFAAFVERAEILLDDPHLLPEPLRATPPGPTEWIAFLPDIFGLTASQASGSEG